MVVAKVIITVTITFQPTSLRFHHLLELPRRGCRSRSIRGEARHWRHKAHVAVPPHVNHVLTWVGQHSLEFQLIVLEHRQQLDLCYSQTLQVVHLGAVRHKNCYMCRVLHCGKIMLAIKESL